MGRLPDDFHNMSRRIGYNPLARRPGRIRTQRKTMAASVTPNPTAAMLTNAQHIELTERYVAHNYHSLPVAITGGEGVWVTDADGKRYMDFLAAYSAINFGHGNRELITAAKAQLDRLTLTSRGSTTISSVCSGPACSALPNGSGIADELGRSRASRPRSRRHASGATCRRHPAGGGQDPGAAPTTSTAVPSR